MRPGGANGKKHIEKLKQESQPEMEEIVEERGSITFVESRKSKDEAQKDQTF